MGVKEETVSVDHLKVAHLDPGVVPPLMVPPKRGRPPRDVASAKPGGPLPIRERPTVPVQRNSRPKSRHSMSSHRRLPSTQWEKVPELRSRAGRPLRATERFGT